MKSEADINGQIIEIDTEGMEQRIKEHVDKQLESYNKELVEWRASRKEARGKGTMEAFEPSKKDAVLKEFKKGANLDTRTIKEQWTIVIPKYAINELAGHLRDYVWVTDVVKGKPGETVNIPIVKDIDFQHVVVKTGTFTAKTGLINVLTTTLHEAGAYYDAYYGDIEKIDSNMLDELNRVFAHAAIRAEDYDLVYLLNTATTGQFLSYGGGTDTLPFFAAGTVSAGGSLTSNYIVDALVGLMQKGKEVHPGECILYCNASSYGELITEVLGNQSVAYSRPDIIQKGLIEDFLGVRLVIGAARGKNIGCHVTTTYDTAWLFRPKRALALAPKRDILIETDKLIATRQLRIAASHTYGVCAIDYTEVIPIHTVTATNVIDNKG